jgi:acetate kinase
LVFSKEHSFCIINKGPDMSKSGALLVLNAGSSSLKFALFATAPSLAETARGEVENLGAAPHLRARDAAGGILAERRWPEGDTQSFATVLDALLAFTDTYLGPDGLAAVGHRIVHGGMHHAAPERVTPGLLEALTALIPLDPLHMPDNIAPIRAIEAARPGLPQIACFDTAFHRTMPLEAASFALPRAITEAGVRRYGFHGLSFEYISTALARQAPSLARGRVIAAHLGAGASLCALQGGKSIATTFGFSVLDGLVMATRCGSLDPGVVFYLARQGRVLDDIEDMLYHRSGLLGVSGISADVRVLLASADAHAREAIELFTYRVACEAGALQGLDGLIFTAGIGENSPAIREAICARLGWLGIRLDAAANAKGANRISAADSEVEVRVMATDEEAVIAKHTQDLLRRERC